MRFVMHKTRNIPLALTEAETGLPCGCQHSFISGEATPFFLLKDADHSWWGRLGTVLPLCLFGGGEEGVEGKGRGKLHFSRLAFRDSKCEPWLWYLFTQIENAWLCLWFQWTYSLNLYLWKKVTSWICGRVLLAHWTCTCLTMVMSLQTRHKHWCTLVNCTDLDLQE